MSRYRRPVDATRLRRNLRFLLTDLVFAAAFAAALLLTAPSWTDGSPAARPVGLAGEVMLVAAAAVLLIRRWFPVPAMGGLTVMAVLSTVLTFALAEESPRSDLGGPGSLLPTLPALGTPAGLVLGFRAGSAFAGALLLILSAVMITNEYNQGTIRMIFMRQPRRVAWLAGRLGALLVPVALALLAAFVVSAATAVVMAQIRGVDTSQWWTLDAAESAGRMYLNVLVATTFFMLAGTALGIVIRSTMAVVMVSFAWAFPLEHIIQDAWWQATGVLPGLVFDTIGAGGAVDVGYSRALLLGIGYAVLFLVIAATSLARRDVTA